MAFIKLRLDPPVTFVAGSRPEGQDPAKSDPNSTIASPPGTGVVGSALEVVGREDDVRSQAATNNKATMLASQPECRRSISISPQVPVGFCLLSARIHTSAQIYAIDECLRQSWAFSRGLQVGSTLSEQMLLARIICSGCPINEWHLEV